MQRVYSAPTSVPVDVVRALLESEGIECEVRGRHLGMAIGEVPPHEAWPSLWVLDDANVAKAEALVEEFLSDDARGHGSWKCPMCGERLDGRMGACWRCARPDDPTDDADALAARMREDLTVIGDRLAPVERSAVRIGIAAVVALVVAWLLSSR